MSGFLPAEIKKKNVLLTALYGGQFGGEGCSDGGITQFHYLYLILLKFP